MNTDVLYNINIKNVYSVFTINNERNKAMHRTNRPRWAIIFKYEGETEYKVKGIKYISNAENMMILPKGSSYKWECTKSGRYYAIEFDAEESCSEIFSFPVDNYEKILQLFKETEYKNNLKNPTYKLDLLKNTYSILLLLLQAKHPSYVSLAKRQKIEPAINFIVNNYNKQIKNDDLAKLTGLSTIYFRKIFTECFGVSPITYVHKLRIKKAKEILQSDYESISDIAFCVGYPDVYDFSRTFKKHTGLSPTNYVKYKKQYSLQ